MPPTFEAIVIGAGAMGSAAAWQLARRLGDRVLVLEQHAAGHDRGSSHGPSRIFRMTYAHPVYVALAQEALAAWEALERDSGRTLFTRTGDLFFGPAGGPLADYRTALEAAGCPFEATGGEAAEQRFGCFRLPGDFLCLHQPSGGILAADRCLAAQIELAAAAGAVLHTGERVLAVRRDGAIEVRTERERYTCERLVVAAGAWLPGLLPDVDPALRVTRQVVGYFKPEQPAAYRPDRMPAWVYVGPGAPDPTVYYGLPLFDVFGVKAARHRTDGELVDPDTVERTVGPHELDDVRAFLSRHIPGLADAPLVDPHVCLYSMRPAERFLIAEHPHDPRILVTSPCSGHGFKFSALIGRIAAELLLDGASSVAPFEDNRALFGWE